MMMMMCLIFCRAAAKSVDEPGRAGELVELDGKAEDHKQAERTTTISKLRRNQYIFFMDATLV